MYLCASHNDLEEERILGLISDDMYYMLKIREAAAKYDVYEQKRLIHLRELEKRIKKQKAEEEKQQKKQAKEKAQKEQEKAIKETIEKDLPKQVEKELQKELQKIFSKH